MQETPKTLSTSLFEGGAIPLANSHWWKKNQSKNLKDITMDNPQEIYRYICLASFSSGGGGRKGGKTQGLPPFRGKGGKTPPGGGGFSHDYVKAFPPGSFLQPLRGRRV